MESRQKQSNQEKTKTFYEIYKTPTPTVLQFKNLQICIKTVQTV